MAEVNPLDVPVVAGMMTWLRDECERQHARAESAVAERDALTKFLDFTVRGWIADAAEEHLNCEPGCAHKAMHDERFDALEGALAAYTQRITTKARLAASPDLSRPTGGA